MSAATIILSGKHAVLAALANPMRKIRRVWVTKNTQQELATELKTIRNVSVVDGQKLSSLLPPGAVHQGIAVECAPLAQPSLEAWLAESGTMPVLLLDQVTDPHNIGAILRSAAAFDAGAVIVTDRHAPQETSVMAKAASGALETVPLIHVVNLAQAMESLKKAGYWIAGLTGDAKQTMHEAKLDRKAALVLGAEGAGMRRLTAERCDFLVRLPMSKRMESLNVSNAAAVALYELYRHAKPII